MEHVVKTRILSANIAKPQRDEQFYSPPPVKLQRQRELKKQILNASVMPETENTMEHVVETRFLNAITAKPRREKQFYMGPL